MRPTETAFDKHLLVAFSMREERETKHSPTLLGSNCRFTLRVPLCGFFPQRTEVTIQRLKHQGRKVGDTFIPIPQLEKVSSHEVKLLAKGHPEVEASEEKKKKKRKPQA